MAKESKPQLDPLLFTDSSEESGKAMLVLTCAGIAFSSIPSEVTGLVLIDGERAFRGIWGIERFLEERASIK